MKGHIVEEEEEELEEFEEAMEDVLVGICLRL
jgi:hypothetical protein